jgi:hypothetical protein
MRFSIRPGKVTCAGIVVIMMVLPNSIWSGSSAKIQLPKRKVEKVEPRLPSTRHGSMGTRNQKDS